MKTVGILGGLGPLAGAHFYKRIVEMSPASDDHEQIPIVLISDPSIPSRILHLEGTGESPVPKLLEVANKLISLGADLIAIPSSTTNIYYSELIKLVEIPIIPMIEEVTNEISKSSLRRIGILATTPTRSYQIYEKHFSQVGIHAIYPDDPSQIEVMNIIARVKGDNRGRNKVEGTLNDSLLTVSDQIYEVACRKWSDSIDGLLLACTEIPVIFPSQKWASNGRTLPKLFSSTDILAAAVVREACT